MRTIHRHLIQKDDRTRMTKGWAVLDSEGINFIGAELC